jgi:hypothetical protein
MPLRGKKPSLYKDYPGVTQKEMNSIRRKGIKQHTSDKNYITKYLYPERGKEKAKKQETHSEISSVNSECLHMDLFEDLTMEDTKTKLL